MEPDVYLGGMIVAFSAGVLYACYKSHLNKKAAAAPSKDEEAETPAKKKKRDVQLWLDVFFMAVSECRTTFCPFNGIFAHWSAYIKKRVIFKPT